jgi:hypothetical protein
MLRALGVTALSFGLAASGMALCAADASVAGPRHDTPYAHVYVYRLWAYFGLASDPTVYCDGTKVAKMDNGRYFMLRLAPGVHFLSFKNRKEVLDLRVEAGFEYFVRIYSGDPYSGSGWVTPWLLETASRVRGIGELGRVKPLKQKDALDPTLVDVTAPIPY